MNEKEQLEQEILLRYASGESALEIRTNLHLKISTRQLQRWLSDWGVIRDKAEAFRLAVKRGRVTYHRNDNPIDRVTIQKKLRFQILQRDNFRCVLCGNTGRDSRLQVDHIDEDKTNNQEDNLQTLCEDCNKGKAYNKR